MSASEFDFHRGKIFTLTADPMRSHDLPGRKDCYRYHEDGGLIVDRQAGVILAMGSWGELTKQGGWEIETHLKQGAKLYDHRPHFLIPGFVDAHTHLPQLPAAGRGGLPLQEWLKRYIFPVEARFCEADFARKVAQLFFSRLQRAGTTTAVVMSTIHEQATQIAFSEALESGLRIFMGKLMMDCHAPGELIEDIKTSLDSSNRLCEEWHGKGNGLLHYLYSPRFALTCSRELLEECGDAANERKIGVHTHLNETTLEAAHALQVHPWARNYTEIYLRTGVISPQHLSILAHQIYPTAEELQGLWSLPVAIVHCPNANYALRSGEFDYMKVYTRGLDRIALGSDVGAGPTLSLFDVMRGASMIAKNELHVFQLFYLATMGGARALGLQTGTLLSGYEADFLVVNPEVANPYPDEPFQDLVETLLVLVSRGCEHLPLVLETYVRGKKVFEQK